MGNSLKKSISDTIDGGSILPTSLYPSSAQDYEQRLVKKVILERRLQPIYNGLSEFDGKEYFYCDSDGQGIREDFKMGRKLEPLELSAFVSDNLVECPICFLVF